MHLKIDLIYKLWDSKIVDAEDPNLEYTVTTEAGTYGRPSVYSEDYAEYNHADILDLLATEDWTLNENPE